MRRQDGEHVSGSERKHASVLVITFGPVRSPLGGFAVRARSIVEALGTLGVRTYVISHWEKPVAESSPASSNAIHVLRRPLRLGWSLELVRLARSLTSQVDAVIVESALLLPALRVARPTIPVIWDTTECETLHYARLERTLENRLRGFVWRQIERWAVRWTNLVVAISETEAAWWSRLFPRSTQKLVVIRHRVPAEFVDSHAARTELEMLCRRALDGPVLLFVGTLAAKHNADAAEWLLTHLAPRLPENSFLVLAGPRTERLESETSGNLKVICLGTVPRIDAVIAGADVCLAPLRSGAGVKTKVIHYLAHGKPVVATPVAMEGLEGAPGVCVTELEDFPTRIKELVNETVGTDVAEARANAQRAWVDAEFGQQRVLEELREALRRVGVAA